MKQPAIALTLGSLAAAVAVALVTVELRAPARAEASCQFILGFATLRSLIGPSVVGDCMEDEAVNPASGDTEQHTTRGLLVWRQADNWTAFTDGHHTWLNGPNGLQRRLNSERFPWEADYGAPGLTAAPVPMVLVGAGDIAGCEPDAIASAEATAKLLDGIEGTVFTLGDLAYDSGTPAEFANCYHRTWGRHKARTRPAPGNHEYGTPGAAGYFGYFGAAAGERGKGYYSYELGAWHVVVINSDCPQVGGCHAGSPQERWLRADLRAQPAACTVAYWHHPRFSSGPYGNASEMQAIWQALYDAGAELVLSGHSHNYERFAPQDALGQLDTAHGLRQFVAGTGGRSHYGFAAVQPNSEVRHSGTYGVLKLTLHPTSYDWEFIPVAGGAFTDSGSGPCH